MAATNAAKAAAAKNNVISDSKEIVEDVKEIVDDTVAILEDTVDLLRKTWITQNAKVLIGLAALTGVVLGSSVSYFVVRSRITKKVREQAELEIQDIKNTYLAVSKEGISLADLASQYPDEEVSSHADILEARDAGKQIITEQGYARYDKVTPAEERQESAVFNEPMTVTEAIIEATTRNIFESDDPDAYFDFNEELKRREEHPNDAYVITKEEFDLNETDFTQTSLTYYDGDDVLTDEKDSPIEEVDRVIGVQNLLRFGHGSGDPKVVYIRNARLNLDFEVSHSDGKFAREVLGFDDGELRHSRNSHRPMRKMRTTDE